MRAADIGDDAGHTVFDHAPVAGRGQRQNLRRRAIEGAERVRRTLRLHVACEIGDGGHLHLIRSVLGERRRRREHHDGIALREIGAAGDGAGAPSQRDRRSAIRRRINRLGILHADHGRKRHSAAIGGRREVDDRGRREIDGRKRRAKRRHRLADAILDVLEGQRVACLLLKRRQRRERRGLVAIRQLQRAEHRSARSSEPHVVEAD